MKILVVDDSKTFRFMLIKLLHELGFKNVIGADSAVQALELIHHDDFGLIMSDWNMPVMNGLELLKQIRANPRTMYIPVVMVTTVGERANVLQAVRVGIQGYLVKPVSKDALDEKMKELTDKVAEAPVAAPDEPPKPVAASAT